MLLIKNGHVVNPASDLDGVKDILIKDDRIEAIYDSNSKDASQFLKRNEDIETIDAKGKIVSPGFIDCHVHFREPGFEYKETIKTGSKAAAKGGFTTVICEPNTKPPIDTPEMVEALMKIVRDKGVVNVYTKACMTIGSSGKEATDLQRLSTIKGVAAISDDGNPITDDAVCEQVFKLAKKYNLIISPHCEDSGHSLMRGETNTRFSNPPYTNEALYVARDIQYAEQTGARLHISHISLKESVDLIKKAKERGVTKITCEVSPHHLVLDNNFIDSYGVNPKVNPPLRSKENVFAMREALADKTIDIIASDHAPHSLDDKKGGAFGLIGLENSIGVIFSEFVDKGILTINDIIKLMSHTPSKIFGIEAGDISVGKLADLTIIDPHKEWIINSEHFESKARNCPFQNKQLKGMAVCTIVSGKIVMNDGKLC